MKTQEIILNENRNVTLTAYIQEVDGEFGFSRRPAMLVIPGGGYAMCSDREADPVAMAYLKAGYQAFVLRYTCTPKGKWPLPLEDYEQAMARIEEHADEWHLDKSRIAVVGFSAGGHLAACAATVAEHKPAAAVLVYPAILKDICDMCQPGMPYPHEHVTAQTCPCFLVAARDDRTVDISNTLRMELALAERALLLKAISIPTADMAFLLARIGSIPIPFARDCPAGCQTALSGWVRSWGSSHEADSPNR